MKNLLFASALLLFGWLNAQSVTGIVTDESGDPLAGANIVVEDQIIGASTDEDGRFSLTMAKTGEFVLSISHVGHISKELKITVGQSEAKDLGTITLSADHLELSQVNVSSTRVASDAPVPNQLIDQEEIENNNTGQDIPYILNQATSLVNTSDAGAGIGYTSMRIRGSDQSRINVLINGIPLNDAESHGVFWVNTPDLASSLSSVQIQRGVGSSTNGSGAFGANINLQTDHLSKDAFAEVHLGMGSFNTQRATLELGSGLIKDHWAVQGRVSKIRSDGYIDRARSELSSYFLSGGYLAENFSLKAIMFGGSEETYQSWYGLDSATYYKDRTYNYAGEIYNNTGQLTGYYDDQVDNYSQNHYQLHFNSDLSETFALNISGHYTRGSGYYEEYQNGDSLGTYGIFNTSQPYGDVVRRLWLDNHFYGVVYNLRYSSEKLDLILGGGGNRYDGDHFGEVVWASETGNTLPDHRFYYSRGLKDDINTYLKSYYDINSKIQVFADLQLRRVALSGSGDDEDDRQIDFGDEFLFFNPKAGITWSIKDEISLYGFYGISNREPNRQDYIENTEKPKAENLHDLELGTRLRYKKISVDVNYFLMRYQDQLVLTGQLNNVGYPIRRNVGKSYRTGIEVEAELKLPIDLIWRPNFTISKHENIDYRAEDLTEYGNTPIAFSPAIIAGSVLSYSGVKNLEISLMNKYVGEQHLDNTGLQRYILPDYFLTDLRIAYDLQLKDVEKLQLELTIFNLANVEYASNGYAGGTPYYYAQAGINFMGGLRLRL